jgi:YVTN family beta-propeller protein
MRLSLLIAPALFVTGVVATQVACASELAFVINSGAASISVLDVEQHREIQRIPVLREPHHMALTPDHTALLVGDSGGNELLFLDPRTGEVKRRLAVSDPYQIEFSPDGQWLVITGLARNQIDVYDAASFKLVKRFPASSMPSHINFSPDSGVAYVTLQGTNGLIAIDLKTEAVLWTAKVGDTPAGVLWHDGKLLVGIMGSDYVAVVDPKDGRVDGRITTAKGAHVLFVPPDRKVIYVTNRVDGVIVVLDPATLKEIRRFAIPGGPDDIDFAPDGKLWVTRRWAHSVAVVDPLTGRFQTIPVGRSPHGIWLNTHDKLSSEVTASQG